MSYHRAIHTLLDHLAERRQLNVAYLIHGSVHHRKGGMGIRGRVAMARKVFHTCNQTLALHSFGVGHTFVTHTFRVFAKTTHSNHRVGGIGVDIHDRREIHMDAHALALLGHLLPHFIDQFVVFDGTQSHLIRIGQGLVDTHGQAPFRIDRDHQRGLGHRLPFVGLLHLSLGIGTKETNASDVVLLDVFRHVFIKRFVRLIGAHAD